MTAVRVGGFADRVRSYKTLSFGADLHGRALRAVAGMARSRAPPVGACHARDRGQSPLLEGKFKVGRFASKLAPTTTTSSALALALWASREMSKHAECPVQEAEWNRSSRG